jgi:NAD(P)-dependent dehydrogenase (short-subunit alcohol dehydrogenase family)
MTSAALKDRVAIVFGSATGIGAACARTLAARGAIVILADIAAAVGQGETEFGRLNIVHNNAAAKHLVIRSGGGSIICRPSW